MSELTSQVSCVERRFSELYQWVAGPSQTTNMISHVEKLSVLRKQTQAYAINPDMVRKTLLSFPTIHYCSMENSFHS